MPGNRETPNKFLSRLIGQPVIVTLKWGYVYKGVLECTDKYMNVVLRKACEVREDHEGEIGDICVRCNNIKMISEAS